MDNSINDDHYRLLHSLDYMAFRDSFKNSAAACQISQSGISTN